MGDPTTIASAGQNVTVAACPSCGCRVWRIEYHQDTDDHRFFCSGCGVRCLLKRMRDLD